MKHKAWYSRAEVWIAVLGAVISILAWRAAHSSAEIAHDVATNNRRLTVDQALSAAWDALGGDVGTADLVTSGGKASLTAKQITLAARQLEKAEQLEPDNAEVEFAWAALERARGRWKVAERRYRRAIRLGEASRAWNGLALVLRYTGRAQEALEACEKAIVADPDNEDPHHQVGQHWFANGDYEKAESAYRRALEINPANATTLSTLSLARAKQGAYREAAKLGTEAVELDPGNPTILHNLGTIYQRMEWHEEAARCYQSAVEVSPGLSWTWLHLGAVRTKLGDAKGARAACARATEVSPLHLEAWELLAGACRRLGLADEEARARARVAYLQQE